MTDTTTTTAVTTAVTTGPATGAAHGVGYDPAQIFDRAADIVLLNGWVQGALMDYEVADRVGHRAAPVCASGAIRIAAGVDPDEVIDTPAERLFAAWLIENGMLPVPGEPLWASFEQVAEWNDHPYRTLAEVAAALRRAARETAAHTAREGDRR